MSKRYHDTDTFIDQTVEFTYEGNEYIWEGDYTVSTWGETADYDYPGDSDIDVTIDHTTSLSYYCEETDRNIDVEPKPSILQTIELLIERNQ
jgi:hypothetical protein